jgi:hypothetical protein
VRSSRHPSHNRAVYVSWSRRAISRIWHGDDASE